MIFRGVELINPVLIPIPQRKDTQELQFENNLDLNVREAWLRAGYPVYYDHMSNKWFTYVDSTFQIGNTKYQETAKCDFGCAAVGSLKHHWQCSARKNDDEMQKLR